MALKDVLGNLAGTLWPVTDELSDRLASYLILFDLLLLVGSSWVSSVPIVAFGAVLAASSVGAFLGLLFAIPKNGAAKQGTSKPSDAGSPSLTANTSLEDISDWLTKTIVGVSLVGWSAALTALDSAGQKIGVAMFPKNPAAALPAGDALIIAAALLAGIAAYLWFYRHLPKVMIDAYVNAPLMRLNAAGLSQSLNDVAPLAPTTADTNADLVATEPVPADGEAPPAMTKAQQLALAINEKYAALRTRPQRIDDWCKGMFGGEAKVTNDAGTRSISAKVTRAGAQDFLVRLEVFASPAPETPAAFFLHNTFPQTTPQVSFDSTGKATLEVVAWGAFTVGVLLDDGTTELELDLSTLPGVSKQFRNN